MPPKRSTSARRSGRELVRASPGRIVNPVDPVEFFSPQAVAANAIARLVERRDFKIAVLGLAESIVGADKVQLCCHGDLQNKPSVAAFREYLLRTPSIIARLSGAPAPIDELDARSISLTTVRLLQTYCENLKEANPGMCDRALDFLIVERQAEESRRNAAILERQTRVAERIARNTDPSRRAVAAIGQTVGAPLIAALIADTAVFGGVYYTSTVIQDITSAASEALLQAAGVISRQSISSPQGVFAAMYSAAITATHKVIATGLEATATGVDQIGRIQCAVMWTLTVILWFVGLGLFFVFFAYVFGSSRVSHGNAQVSMEAPRASVRARSPRPRRGAAIRGASPTNRISYADRT